VTIDQARRFLVIASLFFTGAVFVFFLVAPAVGYPLTWDQSSRIFEIILPVFLGYLGSATHFLFRGGQNPKPIELKDDSGMLGLLIRGPLWVFGIAAIAIVFAFGFTNRAAAPSGSGMSVDALAGSFTAVIGLLAVTTNVAVSYLFSIGERPTPEKPGPAVVVPPKQ
jgi:hypothetical protein